MRGRIKRERGGRNRERGNREIVQRQADIEITERGDRENKREETEREYEFSS